MELSDIWVIEKSLKNLPQVLLPGFSSDSQTVRGEFLDSKEPLSYSDFALEDLPEKNYRLYKDEPILVLPASDGSAVICSFLGDGWLFAQSTPRYPIKYKIADAPSFVFNFSGEEAISGLTPLGRGLEIIEVPSGVTIIEDGAFRDDRILKGVRLPNSLVTIFNDAFSGCRELKLLYLSLEFSELKNIGTRAFRHTDALEYFVIPKGLRAIGDAAFQFSGLKKLDFTSNSLMQIKPKAFSGCNLESLYLIGTHLTVGNEAFSNNPFTAAQLAEGVASLDNAVFAFCDKLWDVTLPKSLLSLGDSVFLNCSVLDTLAYAGTVADWHKIDKNPMWNNGSHIKQVLCSDDRVVIS